MKINYLRLVLIALSATMAFSTFCVASSMSGVTITRLSINRGVPQKIFISTSTPVSLQSHPSCATDTNWNFVIPLVSDTDKALYATLLAAYTSQSLVDLVGPDACDVYPTVESRVSFVTHK